VWGLGFFLPLLAEVKSGGQVMIRTDAAYPAITTSFGGAMLNSTGGKWNLKTPLVGVRRSEYSQSVKFGIPFLFGVSLHRDKVFGSGVELSVFPKMGYSGIFDIRGGGNLVVFHPVLGALDRPVELTAEVLGSAMERIGEWVSTGKKLQNDARAFEFVDLLLTRLLPDTSWQAKGPFKNLVKSPFEQNHAVDSSPPKGQIDA
jgi:hypothetical protein